MFNASIATDSLAVFQEMPTVNLILRRHGHHAQVSGYDRISEHIKARIIQRVDSLNPWQRLTVRALRPLHTRSGSLWYGRAALITEVVAGWQWLRGSDQIFHFVYGENSFRYLGYLKPLRRNYIVCTYHTPPERFSEVVKDRKHLSSIDAAIVVSNVCHDMLSQVLGPDRVHFIPHGVDVDYFVPPTSRATSEDRFRGIFVGSHLRDFAVLADVARRFEQTEPGIEFEVITREREFRHFAGLANVTLRHGVSDEELRAAYQSADFLAMPLRDATANNSLLEAMACGLPIITTDLPGVRDYVDERMARLTPVGDPDALVEEILALRSDPSSWKSMSQNARSRALEFSFERVSEMTESLYRRLSSAGIQDGDYQ